MAGYNKTIIIGRLANNPVLHDNGKEKFAKMTIMQTLVRDGKDFVEYHHAIAAGKQADLVMKYLEKGNLACIEGRLDHTEYEKDGEKKHKTAIIAEKITFLSPKKKTETGKVQEQA